MEKNHRNVTIGSYNHNPSPNRYHNNNRNQNNDQAYNQLAFTRALFAIMSRKCLYINKLI